MMKHLPFVNAHLHIEDKQYQPRPEDERNLPPGGLAGLLQFYLRRLRGLDGFSLFGHLPLIVRGVDQIHRLHQFVRVNERADDNQGAQDIPSPVCAGAEVVIDFAGDEFVPDAVGKPMEPHQGCNSQREPGKDEENPEVMHRFLSVPGGGNDINVFRNVAEHHETIDAKGDEGEEEILRKASVRS